MHVKLRLVRDLQYEGGKWKDDATVSVRARNGLVSIVEEITP